MKWPVLSAWIAVGTGIFPHATFGQSVEVLPEMLVLSGRLAGAESVAATREWSRSDLQQAAPKTLDELLAKEPSFSLYRRQTAIFGNPTSAGVSLRNTGATAASRTLVLLDGIPQNDPFGGWVYWARYDAATLHSIRILPSSLAAVWGNLSPAGVIQMNGSAPFEDRHVFKLGGGSQGTLGGSTVHQMSNAEKTRSVSLAAYGLRSDGFYAVSRSQRGAIDRKLETELAGADLKFGWLAAPGLTIEPMLSIYAEERANGTPLTGNSTDALDFALRITSEQKVDASWQALAWHQRREFDSVFSAVAPDRTSEIVSLDQFDVPARGTGGAFTWQWERSENTTMTAGVDTRLVKGETHEDAGGFRRREAGGEQAFAGVFSAIGHHLDEKTRLDAGVRLDAWELTNGRRLETALATGAPLRTDRQEDRDGLEPSAAIQVSHALRDDWVVRASLGSSFRLPTLNELHRPFRVRSDIVEANPSLEPERFVSVEGEMDWKPATNLEVRMAVFHHWVSDAIANVPVTDPAEIVAIFGSIPPGGSGSQRRNVDQARVFGLEGGLEWRPVESTTLGLLGILSETEFVKSADQPLLEGKPFPQAPDLRLIASVEWRLGEQFSLFSGGEYGAAQFDDALATRSIPDYTSVRLGMSWRTEHAVYQARVENLFNEQIETGLSSDGIKTLAAPRALWIGAEWEF
jgi:outer membrane cobalamin receptor